MRYMKKVLSLVLTLLGLVGMTISGALAQAATPLQPVATPLEKAVMSIGGEEALQNLSSIALSAQGVRWIHDEGYTPGSRANRIAPFTWQVQYDIAGDNLRVDHIFGSGDSARPLSEVIVGELGILDGRNSNFGAPAVSPMLSDRWASARQHQRLLNPHLILRDVLANPESASDGGEVLLDGTVHHLLVVEDKVAPLTLYINAGTGQIAKLSTLESDTLRRDVEVQVFYYGWQSAGEGLFFPTELYIAYDGDIVHKEIRTEISLNAALDNALFEIPADVAPVFDETLVARGAALHQFIQSFAALGFPRDGLQLQVNAAELAPGVFHLTGGSHHSMAIEQAEGIIIVEAPLDETRSQAVMEWATNTFAEKPISHAIASHHHADHSAGLRSYVAADAIAVVHESAAAFFSEVFQAESTLVPDALAENPLAAAIEAVPSDGSLTLADETNPVEVYPLATTHAGDAVITYVPSAKAVFVVDVYSPNPAATDAGPGGKLLYDAITELGIDVAIIVGGHGATIAFEDFEKLVNQ